MRVKQVFLILFLIGNILFLTNTTQPAEAQTSEQTSPITGTNSLTPAPLTSKPIETQAQVVQVKQASEAELQNLIASLEAENENLNKEILNLRNQQIQQETLISKYNQNLTDLKTQKADKNPNLQTDIDQTKKELDQAQKDLLQTKNDLADKQAKLEANQKTIKDAKDNLESKKKEVKEEVNTLQQRVLVFGMQISYYVILITAYWLIWELIRVINKRFIKNTLIQGFVSFIINLLAIGATLITILVAFIGNLTLLITSLGFFSAALVVALQDFVSSFFAWIMVVLSRQYRINNTISITTGKGPVTGKVSSIGVFRTTIIESVGGTGFDKELPTGRILTFPNNLVLKESVTNFNQENDILWHTISVIITFESDHRKARAILESICQDQFKLAMEHDKQYFKSVKNIKQFKPRLYMNIAPDGPEFTIWFATKVGHFRERVEKYSEDILTRFTKEKINLAYTTSRVFVDKDTTNLI